MKQLNSKETRFSRFDKILVIQPIAEAYGEGNERQLCKEIAWLHAQLESRYLYNQICTLAPIVTALSFYTIVRNKDLHVISNVTGKN